MRGMEFNLAYGIYFGKSRVDLCVVVGRFVAVCDDLAAATDKLVCCGWAFSGGFGNFVPLREKNPGEI